jgi:serine/threonine protein kinase
MEYLEGCTLKQYIKNNENILEDDARIIIKQLLTALSYLHYTCDICHRDVKPENIMFKEKDDINSLKLLDFGLSLDRFESKSYLENCGTLVYMAPELLINNVKYTKGVDVWSVGIILYMLLMKGKNPFYNKKDTRQTVIQNIKNNSVSFPNDDNQISNMGKDLINKLLKKNPIYRYTISSALEHPWITMNKFDKIPLTIYDKANFDENVEKLKILLLFSIFLNYTKKNSEILDNRQSHGKSKKYSYNNDNRNEIDNYSFDFGFEGKHKYKNKKIKNSKEIKNKHFFNMDEYEKKVKDSNNYYHLKFLQDREKMFNPKLSLKKNNSLNCNLLTLIL